MLLFDHNGAGTMQVAIGIAAFLSYRSVLLLEHFVYSTCQIQIIWLKLNIRCSKNKGVIKLLWVQIKVFKWCLYACKSLHTVPSEILTTCWENW